MPKTHLFRLVETFLPTKKKSKKTGVSIDFDILKCYHFSANFIVRRKCFGKV